MGRRVLERVLIASLCLPLCALRAGTQKVPAADSAAARVPFGVGERLEYDIRYGKLHVGNGSMEVLPMDTVRGRETWHTLFRLSGGIPFYHVNDRYEAWADIHTLASLRFFQDIDEGSYEPKRHYEIFPDRREFTENDKPPEESVEHPVDDGFLMYYLRTVPLRVGLDTSLNTYFKADRNPVRIRVLRRETIRVPAGEFNAIVVQPIIKTKGVFSEGGEAMVWLSDDENRIMLQLKSKVKFGSLNVYLKSYSPSPTTNLPLNRVPGSPP
jgi:hypothetical protein